MNSQLRGKKEGKEFEKMESRSEVSKHKKMEMKFERWNGRFIEWNMEGQPGDGKREIERFKGMQYRRNMQGGKKEK